VGQAQPRPGAQRNGYRHRDLDTRVGTIDVAVPKLRKGTYFPEWLLERRKRAEAALITVVADCYLAGVSTRRMDKLVKTLGIDSLSKSQVSRMAASSTSTSSSSATVRSTMPGRSRSSPPTR
jgi:putative transposase